MILRCRFGRAVPSLSFSRERALKVRAVFVGQPLKVYADAAAGVAVDDLAVADDVAARERYAQRQHRALRNLRLCVHVEAAGAYVLRARDAREVCAVEVNVDDEPRALVAPALVLRQLAVDKVHGSEVP